VVCETIYAFIYRAAQQAEQLWRYLRGGQTQPGQQKEAAMTETTPSPLNNFVTIDDERIKSHLDRVVRGSVEETLNALLDAEADRLCNAQRYERSEARRDTRAGHYERKLQTKAGEVKLRIPKASGADVRDGIERYRRRESSVEEALIEMYLTGVSVRRSRTSPRRCGARGCHPRRCRA
jgi:hypothetical protein